MTDATQKATAKDAVQSVADTVKESAKKAAGATAQTDTFKAAEDFTSSARDQLEKFIAAFSDNAEDMQEHFSGLNDAAGKNISRTRDHVAEVSSEIAEAARTEMSDAVQFANDLTKAKSFTDAMEIQRNYWTNLFETRVERTKDITERTVKVARKNTEPFTAKTPAFFADTKMFEKFFSFPTKA